MPPPNTSRSRLPPSQQLTWRFTILTILAICTFFVAHVKLSHYLGPERRPILSISASSSSASTNLLVPPLTAPPPPAPHRPADLKRILVMGSHHTGTSIVTRLIMEMGANGGDHLLMLPGNDLKYNEHRLAVEANKRVLSKGHDPTRRRKGPLWVDYGFDYRFVKQDERDLFYKSISRVLADLDDNTRAKHKSAWVLKDPRLSLLAKHWLDTLPGSNTVCVLVVRDALETSVRLAKTYNKPTATSGGGGGSLHVWEWMQVWEESMLNAAHYCKQMGMKIVFVHHRDLVKAPLQFAQKLEADLFPQAAQVEASASASSAFPTQQALDAVLGGGFVASSGFNARLMEPTVWLPHTRQLFTALQNEHLQSLPPLPLVRRASSSTTTSSSRTTTTATPDREAYATIITGDSKGFVAGAIALASSIRQFDSKRTLVAMLSPEVGDNNTSANLRALQLAGWELVRMDKLEEPWYQTHEKCRDFTDSQQIRWGRMFTKLRVYSLVQFDRVLYLDTDVIALRELDYYFNLHGGGGDFFGERSPSHRGVNAGIMLIKPSLRVLQKLITFARVNEPRVFWPGNQVGCTEQELINRFWDCGEEPGTKLNNTRHFDYLTAKFTHEPGREEIAQHGARLAHCLTTKCFKPWEVDVEQLLYESDKYDPVGALQANCDPIMYLTWYAHYLSDGMAPAREALAEPTIGPGGSTLRAIHAELSLLVGPQGENLKRNWKASPAKEEIAQRRTLS